MVFKINGICKKYFFFISDIAVSESIISVLSVIRESRRSFTKIFYCKHDCDNLPIPCRSKSVLVDFGLKFASLCALSFKIYALCIYTFEKIVSTTMMKRHFTNRWNIKHFVNLLLFFLSKKSASLIFQFFVFPTLCCPPAMACSVSLSAVSLCRASIRTLISNSWIRLRGFSWVANSWARLKTY